MTVATTSLSADAGSSKSSPACFTVRDANRQALGFFYFEEEPGRRSAAKLLPVEEGLKLYLTLVLCFRDSPLLRFERFRPRLAAEVR